MSVSLCGCSVEEKEVVSAGGEVMYEEKELEGQDLWVVFFLSLSLRALTLLPLLREAAVSLGPWSCAGGEPHTVVGGPVGTYVGLCGVSAALGNSSCSSVASSSSVANLSEGPV
uniref:Uncharacterized protein n=1 Tax=Knipowitschia caucasica TaxID=637954 RepID=A0AAV2LF96_KNICA